MCRTVHALLSTGICGIQMLVRVFMTIILMIENLIRMILQTFYNFISFMLQLASLVPICVIFLVTTRLKCFMCGGGGPCPVNRGGACDCLMSVVAIFILFFIFRAVGVLDKMFYKLGYVAAPPQEEFTRYVPTPGEITNCSREALETTTVASDTGTTGTGITGPTGTTPVGGDGDRDEGTSPTPSSTSSTSSTTSEGGGGRRGYYIEFATQTETETTMLISDKSKTVTMINGITPIIEQPPERTTMTVEEIFARLGEDPTIDMRPSAPMSESLMESPLSESVSSISERVLASTILKSTTRSSRSVLDYFANNNMTTILYYLV